MNMSAPIIAKKVTLSACIFSLYITFFALIYAYVVPEHFVFPNVEHEPYYKDLEVKIERELQKEFPNSFLQNSDEQKSRTKVEQREMYAAFGEITTNLELKHGSYIYDSVFSVNDRTGNSFIIGGVLFLNVAPKNSGFFNIGSISCTVEIVRDNLQAIITRREQSLSMYCVIRVERNYPNYISNFDEINKEYNYNYLIPEVLKPTLFSYLMSIDGLPDGLFLRMLYMSTVTATTLGYGDILPVTTVSRALIALESVLGLILIGFLGYWITLSVPQTKKKWRVRVNGAPPNTRK
jgi:hypothetical protein